MVTPKAVIQLPAQAHGDPLSPPVVQSHHHCSAVHDLCSTDLMVQSGSQGALRVFTFRCSIVVNQVRVDVDWIFGINSLL